jgi:hypothetical protein
MTDKDFRKAIFALPPRRWRMNRNGSLIKVPLKLETGLLDERVVIGLKLYRRNLDIGASQWPRVDVNVRLRLRQKSDRFGWSGFAEKDSNGDRDSDRQNHSGDEEPASFHSMAAKAAALPVHLLLKRDSFRARVADLRDFG